LRNPRRFSMRIVPNRLIQSTVERLSRSMNLYLPPDVLAALIRARRAEKKPSARNILDVIIENADCALRTGAALCQDTGTVEAYIDVGDNAAVSGGSIESAVEKGVRAAYLKNGFRASIVSDPIERKNTLDNTPVSFYFTRSRGSRIKISLMAKGGGSENVSAVKFIPPSGGWDAVGEFILDTVRKKAPYACAPVIVSAAVGGGFASAPLAAKKALFRKIGDRNRSAVYAARERKLLKKINSTGIGPMGQGGSTTALDVFLTPLPSHIATLACAVAVQCHSMRRASAVI